MTTTMTPDAVRELIGSRLRSEAHFTVTPNALPSGQVARVRQLHRAWLPADEPIFALYDDTLFGSGADGFALTSRRLLWRGFLEHPRQIPWTDLDPSAVDLDEDGVLVAESRLSTNTIVQREALVWLLQELGDRHNGADLPDGPSAEINPEAVVKLARWFIGELPSVFFAPALPERKRRCVQRLHQIGADERVLMIIDDTLFGSAAEGIVLTDQRVCWKQLMEPAASVVWADVERRTERCPGLIGRLALTLNPALLLPLSELINEVLDERSAITARVYCWGCRGEAVLVGGRCSGCGRTLISGQHASG